MILLTTTAHSGINLGGMRNDEAMLSAMADLEQAKALAALLYRRKVSAVIALGGITLNKVDDPGEHELFRHITNIENSKKEYEKLLYQGADYSVAIRLVLGVVSTLEKMQKLPIVQADEKLLEQVEELQVYLMEDTNKVWERIGGDQAMMAEDREYIIINGEELRPYSGHGIETLTTPETNLIATL